VPGLHVAFMGGLGIGVLAVFSIAGLLHTGQKLVFPRGAKLAFVCAIAAVLLRALPDLGLMPQPPGPPYAVASLLWAAAFLSWLRSYWPLLRDPATQSAAERGAANPPPRSPAASTSRPAASCSRRRR
jgi:uncharacterized protein involved in response to NO